MSREVRRVPNITADVDGWQLWETVSEGSPVSPVLPNADALAGFLVGKPDVLGPCDSPDLTFADALAWVTDDGWIPSGMFSGSGMLSGADLLRGAAA